MDKLKQKMQSLREEADANAAKLEEAQAALKTASGQTTKVPIGSPPFGSSAHRRAPNPHTAGSSSSKLRRSSASCSSPRRTWTRPKVPLASYQQSQSFSPPRTDRVQDLSAKLAAAEKVNEEASREARGAHGSAEATAERLEQTEEQVPSALRTLIRPPHTAWSARATQVRQLKKQLTETERQRDEFGRRLKLVESDLEKAEDRAVRPWPPNFATHLAHHNPITTPLGRGRGEGQGARGRADAGRQRAPLVRSPPQPGANCSMACLPLTWAGLARRPAKTRTRLASSCATLCSA